MSFDSSGFGIAPDLDVDVVAARIRAHPATHVRREAA